MLEPRRPGAVHSGLVSLPSEPGPSSHTASRNDPHHALMNVVAIGCQQKSSYLNSQPTVASARKQRSAASRNQVLWMPTLRMLRSTHCPCRAAKLDTWYPYPCLKKVVCQSTWLLPPLSKSLPSPMPLPLPLSVLWEEPASAMSSVARASAAGLQTLSPWGTSGISCGGRSCTVQL